MATGYVVGNGWREVADTPADAGTLNPTQATAVAPVYIGAWSGRPAASTAAGRQMQITDVGGRSYWRSDGTNWRPVNGRVQLANFVGTLAAPVATVSSVGTNVFTLPSSITIPGGMAAVAGARIGGSATLIRSTLGGSAVAVGYCGLNLSASASSFSYSLPAIGILGIVAAANQVAKCFGAATVINSSNVAGDQGYSSLNSSSVNANYAEYALDMTAATFVRVVCDSLVSGDVVGLLNVSAWLEF